jgi:hypothetical protein
VQFFPPKPNPFVESAAFGLWLEAPGQARLEVFDLGGRRVHLVEKNLEAGRQELVLPAGSLPGAGLYAYRLQANGGVLTGRVVRK